MPSITEFLHTIGLENEVVGITKFCVHPQKWHKNKQHIGGTKNINIKKLESLAPDFIIASKEENVQEQIIEIKKFAPVFTTDIININSAYFSLLQIGTIIGKQKATSILINDIKKELLSLKPTNCFNCIYLIWKNPYFTIGGDTFINDVLHKMGFQNLLKNTNRYPEISIEQMQALKPDIIFLSSEPYPFKQKHIAELNSFLPNSKIILVDGEIFSWYGSKMLEIKNYYQKLIKQLC